MLDPTAFGAISVAHSVLMGPVTPTQVETIRAMSPNALESVSAVMSRVRFVEELRYSTPLDRLDLVQCMHRDALETYLLCTCLDTLAGANDYLDLQSWLGTQRRDVLGFAERRTLLDAVQAPLATAFAKVLPEILAVYNRHYGINQKVRELLESLPSGFIDGFAGAYTINREAVPDSESAWKAKTSREKMRTIFIDYLMPCRRNNYTHRSQSYLGFGGVSAARESLRAGDIELPAPTTRGVSIKDHPYLVTCHYGDEALFLREVLFTCLAWRLGVLIDGWTDRYREAERQKRMVHALLYEVQHNIQVMQFYLGVLSAQLISRVGDGDGWPASETTIAQALLNGTSGQRVPLVEIFLDGYVREVLKINSRMEECALSGQTGSSARQQHATRLLAESRFSFESQRVLWFCMQLLQDYPRWTYDEYYSPSSGSP